ncbi:hypothetical protein JCM11251_001671 [Rhodosporidiobolus azoricus]
MVFGTKIFKRKRERSADAVWNSQIATPPTSPSSSASRRAGKLKRLLTIDKLRSSQPPWTSPPSPPSTPPQFDSPSTPQSPALLPLTVISPAPSPAVAPSPPNSDSSDTHLPVLPTADYVRKCGEILSGRYDPGRTVWRVCWPGREMVVKGGTAVNWEEGEWTDLARRESGLTIIPKFYGAKACDGQIFLFFESRPGTSLQHFYGRASFVHTAEGAALIKDIAAAFQNLHEVKAPLGAVGGGFAGQNIHAINIPLVPISFPLFSTSSQLYDYLKNRYALLDVDKPWDLHLAPLLDPSTPLVLVHGDPSPGNILVDEYGQLSGLVDFEFAGWYPAWIEQFRAAMRLHIGGSTGPNGILVRSLFNQDIAEMDRMAELWRIALPFLSRSENA